jgi:phosphoglucomutase/phosphomannomutase/phosphoglucomutase
MAEQLGRNPEYRCPGEPYSISQGVHLGRLARFYPPCRQCLQRDDTGTLSARSVERLVETRPRGLPRPLFHDEGAGGVYLNDLTPGITREMAAALGVALQRRDTLGNARGTVPSSLREDGDSPQGPPVVVIAGDGRPISCELVAAVGEGLRWAGCRVIDIGPATAACAAFAVDHLAAGGGILVGNPDDRPQTAGLKFWAAGPWPLSAGGALDRVQRLYRSGVDRPTRSFGPLRRFQADVPYLAGLAEFFHALRPLRFVLDTASGPLLGYLKRLTKPVACRIVHCRTTPDRLPEVIRAEKAHFAVRVGGDGETCHLFDEQGRPVPAERLLVLLARQLLGDCPDFRAAKMGLSPSPAHPQRAVVLEQETPAAVAQAIRAAGARAVFSSARRAEMAAAMREHAALLGGGASGRLWHDHNGLPLPDALRTLSLLLVLLSQSDRPLSEVLDRRAPLG